MYCMKCGKETQENHVFCDACLAVMSKKPVKSDIAIQLPVRTVAPVKKAAPRKRQRTAEEQLRSLRGAVKWMGFALTCVVTALALTVSLWIHSVSGQDVGDEIGKNYNTVNTIHDGD